MKKWLALMFVSAFVGSVVSAQYLVYDYKANVKYLEDELTKMKVDPSTYDGKNEIPVIWDSYDNVADTLKGFLVIPVCMGCNESGAESSIGQDDVLMYVTRKGDKTKGVWKMIDPKVSAAMFKKGLASRDPFLDEESWGMNGPFSLKSMQNGMSAWMTLEYVIPPVPVTEAGGLAGPTKFGNFFPYGLLGLATGENVDWATRHAGFGKAGIPKGSEAIPGVCGYDPQETCMVVKTISGNLVGDTAQYYICWTAIWDICVDPFAGEGYEIMDNVPYGVVFGSWSVKLNKKVSAEFVDVYDSDEFFQEKLGGKYRVVDGDVIGSALFQASSDSK